MKSLHKLSCALIACACSFSILGAASEAYANCAGMKAAFNGVTCEKKVMIQCPANSKFMANNGKGGKFTGPHGASERSNFEKDGYGNVDPGSGMGPEQIVAELCSDKNKWEATTGKCTCPKEKEKSEEPVKSTLFSDGFGIGVLQ